MSATPQARHKVVGAEVRRDPYAIYLDGARRLGLPLKLLRV
jgi:hypothetical protein